MITKKQFLERNYTHVRCTSASWAEESARILDTSRDGNWWPFEDEFPSRDAVRVNSGGGAAEDVEEPSTDFESAESVGREVSAECDVGVDETSDVRFSAGGSWRMKH